MNERLQKYLTEKRQEKKRELLLQEGLYEKVMMEKGFWEGENDDSVEYEWDYSTQSFIYYKKVPIEITDEEYEQLKAVCDPPKKTVIHRNVVATVLTCIAWLVFIGGFIFGGVMGDEGGRYGEFAFDAAFICWIIALISGTMLLGYAEIIKLLQAIKDK